jgi:hypothetical protein
MARIINYLIVAIVIFAMLTAGHANAELKVTKPSEACGYLTGIGLAPRGWKNYYGDVYGCTSPYKELGSGFPLKNNLAYYVEGTATAVRQLKLVLNVNNRAEAEKAHAELLKAAELLAKKSLNKTLPANILVAITEGENVSSRIGDATVDVLRDDWPTGKGYEIKVIIK